MKRIVLLLTLLLAAPLFAAVPGTRTITTRVGKSFYECKIVRVHPDGVSFTHRDGAAKIAFKDLPESLRREFRYDPQKATAYQREQEALRQEELKRHKLREIAMEEKLMEAQMAEASYLAAANAPVRTPVVNSMSLALPGESLPVLGQQTPSWVGAPIHGEAAFTNRLGGMAIRMAATALVTLLWGRLLVPRFTAPGMWAVASASVWASARSGVPSGCFPEALLRFYEA
jgi:hypothetical protein